FKTEINNVLSNYSINKVVLLATSKSKHLKDGIEYEGIKDSMFLKFKNFNSKSNLRNIGVYISTLGKLTETIQKLTLSSLESIIEKDEFRGIRFEDILEKSEDLLIRETKFEVIDIDNINDISLFIEKDKSKNYFQGDVILENSFNTIAISTKRLLIANGIRGINIIETPDVVYISNKKSDNSFLAKLKGREELETGVTSYRPWGSYTVIDKGENYQIKKIIVNPGESLSLQLHYHRSEHWVVIKGTAKVTVDEKVIYLKENESTFIPKTAKHRLENPGKIPLEIIEIQIGEYISESDIVRFQDIYGRTE
ncbi:MAG: cupin domain-containing protein, partial [Brevinematia bacterium]